MLTAALNSHLSSLLPLGFKVSVEWPPLAEWRFGMYRSDDLSVVYLGLVDVCFEWEF
jgi:hypothetical protein